MPVRYIQIKTQSYYYSALNKCNTTKGIRRPTILHMTNIDDSPKTKNKDSTL